jgi:hypothetical protein
MNGAKVANNLPRGIRRAPDSLECPPFRRERRVAQVSGDYSHVSQKKRDMGHPSPDKRGPAHL